MHTTTKTVKTEHLEVYTRFKYFSWHQHIDDVDTEITEDYIIKSLIRKIASIRIYDDDIIIYSSEIPSYLKCWKEIKDAPKELLDMVRNNSIGDDEDKEFIAQFIAMIL